MKKLCFAPSSPLCITPSRHPYPITYSHLLSATTTSSELGHLTSVSQARRAAQSGLHHHYYLAYLSNLNCLAVTPSLPFIKLTIPTTCLCIIAILRVFFAHHIVNHLLPHPHPPGQSQLTVTATTLGRCCRRHGGLLPLPLSPQLHV